MPRVRRFAAPYRPWRGSGLPTALVLAILVLSSPARACDLCAVYLPPAVEQFRSGLRAGIAEQFTHFATLQEDGDEVEDAPDERIESSVTQFVLGYDFNAYVGLQLNVPVISRQYTRAEEGGLERGDETGFGDLSLVARLLGYRYAGAERAFQVMLFGGLKLPSGDPDRLGEETHGASNDPADGEEDSSGHQDDGHDDGDHGDDDHEVESGVHGHDLALGSGSVDGIAGAAVFASWKRLFASGTVHYAIRSEGDFDYQYANDLMWSGGPGWCLFLGQGPRPYSLGAQLLLSGESKGKDTQDGEKVDDTGLTSLYLGPSFRLLRGESLAADLAVDVPVLLNNTGLQIVPDYRLRAGLTWHF